MKARDFEQRVQRQALRTAPQAWRGEILAAARASTWPRGESPSRAAWPDSLRAWLWPHPAAWGGFVACWVAILILQHAAAPTAAEIARTRAEARFAAAYSTLWSHPAASVIVAEPNDDPLPAHSEPRSPDLGRRDTSPVSICV